MRRLVHLTGMIFVLSLSLITLNLVIHQNDHPVSYWIGFLSSRTKRLDQQLYRMRADGKIVEQLTVGPTRRMAPSWSPDGDWIAFTSMSTTSLQIFKVPAVGGNTEQITPTVTGGNGGASWSPDGQWMAYASNRLGRTAEIFVMNLADGTEYRLTDSFGSNRNPVWSPDGQWIAFVSERHGAPEIYRIRPDGTDEQRLTDSRGFNFYPTWSPDGQWIAFTSNRAGVYQIFKMRVDGSQVQQLTHEGTANTVPAWSPDGNFIAYVSEREGEIEIYRMRADGTQKTRLTASRGDNVYPTWSPPSPSPYFHPAGLLLMNITLILPIRQIRAAAAALIRRLAPPVSMPPGRR